MGQYLVPRCTHPNYVSGCSCCQAYGRAAEQRRRRMQAYGLHNDRRDAAEVVAHIRELMASGLSTVEIAKRAGTVHTTVMRVLRTGRAMRLTIDRLMTVRPDDNNAIGTTRRLQALAAAGYSMVTIGDMLQLSKQTLGEYRAGTRQTVQPRIRRKVAQAYEQLWMTAGGCRWIAVQAEKRGWLPPEAWDLLTIDDPDAQPYAHIDPDYVDEVKVKRALDKQCRFSELNRAERRAMLKEAGVTDPDHSRGFRSQYDVNLQQIRVALGLVEDARRRPGVARPDAQVGARVKAALKKAGIYQQDLAEMLGPGCSPAHVSRRILGKVGFPEQDLQRIADLTGTSVQYLRDGVIDDGSAA